MQLVFTWFVLFLTFPALAQIEDFNPLTKESRVVLEEEILPNRAYFHEYDLNGLMIFSVSFKTKQKLQGYDFVREAQAKSVNKPIDSDAIVASDIAYLSQLPLTQNTILPGSFFGLTGDESRKNFRYIEEVRQKQDGTRYLDVKWLPLAKDDNTLPTIRSGRYTWVLGTGTKGWNLEPFPVYHALEFEKDGTEKNREWRVHMAYSAKKQRFHLTLPLRFGTGEERTYYPISESSVLPASSINSSYEGLVELANERGTLTWKPAAKGANVRLADWETNPGLGHFWTKKGETWEETHGLSPQVIYELERYREQNPQVSVKRSTPESGGGGIRYDRNNNPIRDLGNGALIDSNGNRIQDLGDGTYIDGSGNRTRWP